MRRAIEVLVLVVFVGIGLGAITGRLPLPRLDIDATSLGPFEATTESASGCASCTADCPLAGGGSQDETATGNDQEPSGGLTDVARVPVHEELSNSEELPEAIADATELPLSGGVVTETRRGLADGQRRVWVDIATSSPLDETTDWYKTHLSEAGWELLDDQPGVVPNGEFLSFGRDGIVLNVLFESAEQHTRVFVDYPQERS
ncbi:MAG: hypothetical protein ACOCRN_01575 [Spirochaetia bacterium]